MILDGPTILLYFIRSKVLNRQNISSATQMRDVTEYDLAFRNDIIKYALTNDTNERNSY